MTHSAALPDSAFPDRAPHIPVLLTPLLAAVAPVQGIWLDGLDLAGAQLDGIWAPQARWRLISQSRSR